MYVRQKVISKYRDSSYKWKWYDFVFHYYFGGADGLELTKVGLMRDTINLAHTDGIEQVGERLERQVLAAVKENGVGVVSDTFSNGYDFSDVNFVLAESKVYGDFEVEVEQQKNYLVFRGIVNYNFEDHFKDPLDIIQTITFFPDDVILFIKKVAVAKNWSLEKLTEIYNEFEKVNPDDIWKWVIYISEPGGKPYPITGAWKTKITGAVLNEKNL